MRVRKKYIILFDGFLILALPFIGFALTKFTISILPMNNRLAMVVGGAVLIAVLLTIPYLMLKLLFHNAHLANRGERELQLKDLPKNAQTRFIEKSKKQNFRKQNFSA